MLHKLFKYIFFSILVAVILIGLLVFAVMYQITDSRQQKDLEYALSSAASYIQKAADPKSYLDSLESVSRTIRYTWINKEGNVLYDSKSAPSAMENHNSRPEVIQARETGHGKSRRYSATLDQGTMYISYLLDDGSVLRVSRTSQSVWAQLLSLVKPLLLIIGITLLFSAVLADRLAQNLIAPILSLDLEHPEMNTVYDELSPLLLRVIHQKQDIRGVMENLQKQRRELEAVTAHMNEGLVILNMKSSVLIINKAALDIFGAEQADIKNGCHILEITRSTEIEDVIMRAKTGTHADVLFAMNERMYRISADPVIQEDTMTGIVLLIVDITEKSRAEQTRREFTANVSHELKTPLTSISGYAEIIRDGLAAQDDIPSFAGKIVAESARLIQLIDDIIKLSRLDEAAAGIASSRPSEHHQSEGNGLSFTAESGVREGYDLRTAAQSGGSSERVLINLSGAAHDAAERLQKKAEESGVTFTVRGSADILGTPVIIDEMIYNLCENAVKYNVRGGSVTVTVGEDGGSPFISVADTGIGIPEGEHEKVFERFYRVDKSRSKETGGTGLGLSIVKHAAQYHDASIALTSIVGKGTEITVRFPKQTALV